MKIKTYIFLSITLVFASFCGGTYFGFNTGVLHYHHLENVLSSNIDVLRSHDLRGGSEKELKHIYWEYETSINSALDSYIWYQEFGNHSFAKIFLSGHLKHLDKSITHIANYRKAYPIQDDTEILLCDLLDSSSEQEGCKNMLEKRQELIDDYGSKKRTKNQQDK